MAPHLSAVELDHMQQLLLKGVLTVFLFERKGCRCPFFCSKGMVAVGRFCSKGRGAVGRFFARTGGLPLAVFCSKEGRGVLTVFLFERKGCRCPFFCSKGRGAVDRLLLERKGAVGRFSVEARGEGRGGAFFARNRGADLFLG